MSSDIQERCLIDGQGKPIAAAISLSEYEQLQEDLHDLAVIAERREVKSISIADTKRRLSGMW